MKIGYARTSTLDQVAGYEAQIRDLKKLGVEKVFAEQLSSVDAKRQQLEAAIDYCREGDVLTVTKLDRLARSVRDLVKIEERLKAKGASLHVMDPQMDTSTSTGRLTLNVLISIAQFEREIMLERQREGIVKAQNEGRFMGRKPTAMEHKDEVIALLKAGLKPSQIVEQLGDKITRSKTKRQTAKISVRSVYRILADEKAAGRLQ
jgi:DNA invertase Pin-like site-specific DNA recombinase